MKVISIVNQKGGVGKTTIATNLSCISAKENETVLIDGDFQESSMKFRSIRPDSVPQFQAVSITTPTIHKDINMFASATYVFIDAGGRDTKAFRSVLLASDVVLIPVLPGQYDLWSSEETLEIVEEMRLSNPDIKAGLVLNRVISGTNISKDVLGLMNEFVEKYELKLFDTMLYARVGYPESISEGLGVTEIKMAKYDKAREEMQALYNEVINWA